MKGLPIVVVFMLCFLFLLSSGGCNKDTNKSTKTLTKSSQNEITQNEQKKEESVKDTYTHLTGEYTKTLNSNSILQGQIINGFDLKVKVERVVYDNKLFLGIEINGAKYKYESSIDKHAMDQYISIYKNPPELLKAGLQFQAVALVFNTQNANLSFYSFTYSLKKNNFETGNFSTLGAGEKFLIKYDDGNSIFYPGMIVHVRVNDDLFFDTSNKMQRKMVLE
jgi:hypothetical protein